MTFKQLVLKKRVALRNQALKVNPVTFGLKESFEQKNKSVLDSFAARLAAK